MAASRFSKADLGARVTALYRLDESEDHPFNEVFGVLQSIKEVDGDVVYVVVRKSGEEVHVAESALISAKLV